MADPPPPPPQGLGSPAAWASPLPPPGSPSERRGIAGGAGLSQRLGAASPLSTSLLRGSPGGASSPALPAAAGEGAWPRSASSGSRSLPRLEPLSPSVSPTGRSRGSGGGASLAELPPDDGRAGPPPLPALRAWASPKGAGPGLSSPGAGGGGTGAYPPPLHSSDGESALARFQRGVAQVRPQLQQSDPNAATARGPVKWAPHFHSNPKHAKFCFLCLHSRLHGAQQAASEETSSGAASDDDLPPPAELQRLGYLHSGSAGSSFRREPVDFEQGNVAATWLRWVQDRAYVSLVKPFIAEHNSRQSCGNDVGLVFHHEEEKDRDVLAGIFSLTERQEVNVHLRLEKLGRWCASRETGLMDVMPEPARRPPLPHVEPLGQSQLEVLRYRPLLDADLLRGSSGRAAREAARAADASAGRLGAEGPPRPATSPSAPEAEILAFPLAADIVPRYEPWLPRAPRRRPVDACVDPLERPFLSLPSFAEGVMPQFGTGRGLARARPPRPAPVPEECLSQTFSLFEDNNAALREQAPCWGQVPPRPTPSAPLIEDPCRPPTLVVGAGERGRLVDPCLWDPDLRTPAGKMVPPLQEYGTAIYRAYSIPHPDEPFWTRVLSPVRDYGVKIRDTISLVPVRSFRKFRPQAVSVAFPRFLFDLAFEDPSGQDTWAVLAQRRAVPPLVRQAEAARERAAAEARRGSELPAPAGGSPAAGAPPAAPAQQARLRPPPGAEAARPPRQAAAAVVAARGAGEVPDLEVAVPAVPPLETTALAPREALAASYPPGAAAAPEPGPPAQPGPEATLRPAPQAQRAWQASGDAVRRGGGEALLDDSFMDALAEKITLRLGAGTFEGGGAAPASQGMRGATLAPDLPSFAEPEARVDATRVPPALLPASSARAQTEAAASTLATVSDVNMFTQEKMYFESYVRLLVKPEQVAAQRHAVPYPGEMLAPDISLITMGSKPNMAMPPKAPEFDESGNMIEDEDNFDEFERNNAVAFSFVRHNRYEPIESLMQQDTDVLGVTDPMGNTLLHVACQNNNRRIVKLLVKHGVRLDAQNNSGNTALHYCIQYGFVQLADFLMAHGADDSIANAAGYLPAQGLGKDSGVEAAQAGLRAGGAA